MKEKIFQICSRFFSYIRIFMSKNFWRRYWTLLALLRLKLNGAKVGDGFAVFGGPLRVTNLGNIKFGKSVRINSGPSLNYVGGNFRSSFWVGKYGELRIDDNVGLSGVTIVSFDQVTVGENTLIGGGVFIFDTDFHSLPNASSPVIKNAPVHVGKNCFVGANSIILKGVNIGDGCVIAAGAVVSRDIPDGEVWGGNPARKIR